MKQLIIKNLTVILGNNTIIEDLSLEIPNNQFLSIVGRSGGGKTTLMKALSGFAEIKGEIIKPNKIGMVFQKSALYPWMTVYENIKFATIDDSIGDINSKIDECLKFAGILKKKNSYLNELSGGELQRVAIVRSLIHNPDILILDEPFSSLDEFTRHEMQVWLKKLWEKNNLTIIFITHNIEEAIYLSERIIILEKGKIVDDLIVSEPEQTEIKIKKHFNSLC